MSSKTILLFLLLLISKFGISQSKISVLIPSVDEETDYIWRNLQDIPFFDENGYKISLPKGKLIDELVNKSRKGVLNDKDYPLLKSFISDSVYKKTDYISGYKKVKAVENLVHRMLVDINASHFNGNFKKFDEYKIVLTLYGPGGSYDPDTGSILLFTTTEGKFKNYDNPANTIIHEIIHIGIEESLVQQCNIPHALKERIVDQFVSLYFGAVLKDYKIQDMGDYRIDSYLKTKVDVLQLEKWVKSILN
ncbi:hypothetical protein ACOKFD_03500 [Flagellimonas sp. S174]|uniref:hypothetical protein n=1 Tax=Flagellimonas sp. S174 TaxID=3410790 RepID=UPI003BF5900B